MITDDDIERFCYGDCHVLADELSKITGWTVWAFDIENEADVHAFVRTPSGHPLDIYGLHRDLREFKGDWFPPDQILPRLRRTSHAECSEFWGHEEAFPESRKRAAVVAPLLLAQAGFTPPIQSWLPTMKQWGIESPSQAPQRWQINLDGLSDAIDFLKVKREVNITTDWRDVELAASWDHFWRPGDIDSANTAVVDVRPGVSHEAASMLLWHELTHVAQAERFDSLRDFWSWYESAGPYSLGWNKSYYESPAEIEAFANMRLHFKFEPLCLPAENLTPPSDSLILIP